MEHHLDVPIYMHFTADDLLKSDPYSTSVKGHHPTPTIGTK
jgi:hypothetical protein